MTLHWYDRLPSTMDRAHELAAAGAEHGVAVAARIQDAGRGRRGRGWQSPEGGLWLSVVCRPVGLSHPECLSLRIGLAVAQVLEAELPGLPPVGLKWPNDLYLDDRKVAGVLCEARWDGGRPGWIVAGVGVNVSNAIPPDLVEHATTLAAHVSAADPVRLAEPVAAVMAGAGRQTGPLNDDELAAFAGRDWLRGKMVGTPVLGMVVGIESDGALRILDPGGGEVRVRSGEVTLRQP